MIELRDYQSDTLERIAAAEQRGIRRQLVVAATGLGKTVIFTALARQRGGRALILAHRDELIGQAVAKVVELCPELPVTGAAAGALSGVGRSDLMATTSGGATTSAVGVVKGIANDVHARIVVASVQTLARPARLDQLLRPFDGRAVIAPTDPFDLVIVDEAHHATAPSYRTVLDALRAGAPAGPGPIPDDPEFDVDPPALPAGPLLVGFTATPDRGDGTGLDAVFDEVVAHHDMLWGIRSGFLSDLRGLAITVDRFDEGDLRTRRGDYDQGQAARVLSAAGAPDAIVRAWRAHAGDRARTLVFTPTVDFASQVANAYTDAGIAAGVVTGADPLEQRQDTLARFHRGELRVLANCAVLTEGYDEPLVDCVVVARPTKSRALYTQMVGRGTRRHPAKVDALILDVVGASTEHSLVTVPSLFGVEREHRERGASDRTMAELVGEQEQLAVSAGRLRADEVALMRADHAKAIAWVAVATADGLQRFVRPLAEGRPTVVLAERPGEVWTAGLLHADNTKSVLIARVSQELAQGMAEDYARRHGGHVAKADAAWRKGTPSPKAKGYARSLGIRCPKDWTAGDLADAIDRAKASRRVSRGA